MGHAASGVDSLHKAWEYLKRYEPDLIISDMRLPDGDCIGELPVLGDSHPVIVLTAYGTVKNAVEAIQAGAADYLSKPVSPEELTLTVQRVLDTAALKADHQFCKARLKAQTSSQSFMIGHSPALERSERKKALSKVLREAHCFWTRSERFHPPSRLSCYEFWRLETSGV